MPAAPTGKGNGPANADIDPQRLSFVSGVSQAKDVEEGYVGMKTPQPIGAPPPGGPDGALRDGGMPREPLDKRGKTQSCIYTVRTVVVILGEVIVGFCFNGEEYGGDFDFSLSFPQLMIIMMVLTLPVLPMTWFFIKEDKCEAANFREYINSFWELLCSRAVYQVIAYIFFSGIFANVTYTASSPVQSYMVGVTPINSTLSDILSNLLFAAGIMITSKWGLHWNWRFMIVLTGAIVMVVDSR
ncbi:hypothetical protein PRNP1_015084 [Phytophthora ramorum]